MSPTWRLTLAATDVCEDPAQYGRLSAPWTGIQQIKNGVHIGGARGRSAGVLAVVQERGGSSAGMGWHLMPGVERRALPLGSSQAQDGTGEFARALDVLACRGPAR